MEIISIAKLSFIQKPVRKEGKGAGIEILLRISFKCGGIAERLRCGPRYIKFSCVCPDSYSCELVSDCLIRGPQTYRPLKG